MGKTSIMFCSVAQTTIFTNIPYSFMAIENNFAETCEVLYSHNCVAISLMLNNVFCQQNFQYIQIFNRSTHYST